MIVSGCGVPALVKEKFKYKVQRFGLIHIAFNTPRAPSLVKPARLSCISLALRAP